MHDKLLNNTIKGNTGLVQFVLYPNNIRWVYFNLGAEDFEEVVRRIRFTDVLVCQS